jgi:xylose isomerase
LAIINQGGLAPGGLNFDCKIRRESSDLEDLFISHIAAMDNLAFALKRAALIHEEKILSSMVDKRYITFATTDLGKKIESGAASLEDCEAFVRANGHVEQRSGQQEKFESIFNNYFL